LSTFVAQRTGGVAGTAGGLVVVQAFVTSEAGLSPMIRMHEPENEPEPVTLISDPFAVAETWKDVFPPLVVAFRTK